MPLYGSLKITPNDLDIERFLNTVEEPGKREDCFTLPELMKKLTKEESKVWRDSIIGFDSYHNKYDSGREGGWFLAGFAPGNTIFQPVSCLYINTLADIKRPVLRELIKQLVNYTAERPRSCPISQSRLWLSFIKQLILSRLIGKHDPADQQY